MILLLCRSIFRRTCNCWLYPLACQRLLRQNARMQYLVAFALLVALAAWMVGVYNQLAHLRGQVCSSWSQWLGATHRRNLCLKDYAAAFAAFFPQNAPVPLHLQRLAEDSEYAIALALEPRWGKVPGFMGGAEKVLRQAVAESVCTVEDTPRMREHEHMQRLTSGVSAAMYQQDQLAALFNRAAREYNNALSVPSARLLAPVFGFARANTLD